MEVLRPAVVQRLTVEKLQSTVRARAAALEARIRKGESIDAVAASTGATVQTITGLSRVNAQQFLAAGRDLIGGAFNAKKGDVYTGVASNGIAVATVTALRAGDINQVARAARQGQRPFSEEVFKDMRGTLIQYAITSLKAKSSLVNARAAIGGPAPEEPAAKPKGK